MIEKVALNEFGLKPAGTEADGAAAVVGVAADVGVAAVVGAAVVAVVDFELLEQAASTPPARTTAHNAAACLVVGFISLLVEV
jgi:hypothetical protein